jgi:hypothetical protein
MALIFFFSFYPSHPFTFLLEVVNLGMTSEGLKEMVKCDFADMCTIKFPLVLIGAKGDKSSINRFIYMALDKVSQPLTLMNG